MQPGDFDRLFVVEQDGRIRVIRGGEVLPAPFLDLTDSVSSGGERGLLSVAFVGGQAPQAGAAARVQNQMLAENAFKNVTVLHANGGVIVMDQAGTITIRAKTSVDIVAATLNVRCPEANFANVINCVTLNASAGIVAAAYTPAAGNMW